MTNMQIARNWQVLKNLRVTHISHRFFPELGGLEQHVYYVTKNLVKFGVKCYVLAARSNKEMPTFTRQGRVLIERIGHPVDGPVAFSNLVRHYSSFFRWYLKILKFHERSDIIHIHGPLPLVYRISPWHSVKPHYLLKKMSLLKKPVVITFHGLHTHYQRQYLPLDGMDVEVGNYFIGVDRSICKDLQTYFKISRKKVFYIPNGVDTSLFYPSKPHSGVKKRLFKDVSVRVILLPRRVDPKNGILQAVEAFSQIIKQYDDVKMLILGFGASPFYSQFEKQVLNRIKELGLNRHIIPHKAVANEIMPMYYNMSYVSLIPSLWEATSLSALESLACGTPVVASNTGGLPELITKDVGLLHEPGNIDDMVEKLNYLLENPQARNDMSEKGVAFSRKNDWITTSEKVLNVYRTILE